MKRIEFRLTMPRREWDGGWSGADRKYLIVRTVTDKVAAELMDDGGDWYYRWDDGWVAAIRARVMRPGERAAKSDGFCGYDWMVRNILAYGSPYTSGTSEGMAGVSS